jgi:5-formyltetrahydrofolate cyclo-ligase
MPRPPSTADVTQLKAGAELHEDDLRRRVKRELRKRLRGLRGATPLDACAERSSRIIEKLEALDAVRAASKVALFWPILARHEVDLRAFDDALRRRGARVAYPAIEPASEPASQPPGAPGRMTFRFVDDVTAMEERGFGFAEPSALAAEAPVSELDVVIVPALALDPTGQRIGYGAGYYDRALAGTVVVKVGVIFDFQLVSEVPATDGDVPVDWVVTDARTLRASR